MATPTIADEERLLDKDNKPYVRRTLFWSCPVRFIPPSVWSFLQHRTFYERHPSSPFPRFGDVASRYLQAEATFEVELSKLMMEDR